MRALEIMRFWRIRLSVLNVSNLESNIPRWKSAEPINCQRKGGNLPSTAPHPIVEVEDMGLNLISRPIFRQLCHLDHVKDATGIAFAALDKEM
jgi:hypothetical protein